MKINKPINIRTLDFALEIIELYKILKNQNEYILSKQLLRAGTSIGANVAESQGAQSTSDFLHKMYIAVKEARETKYWLTLLSHSNLVEVDLSKYLVDVESIIKIISKIIITTKKNSNV